MQMTRSTARPAAQESDSVELPGRGILAWLKEGRSGEWKDYQGESREGCRGRAKGRDSKDPVGQGWAEKR